VYVDDRPFVLREVRDLNITKHGRPSRFGSPYFGLTSPEPGGPGPRMPMDLTEMEIDGQSTPEAVYWISHLRIEALLPRTSSYPTTGLARRRFVCDTQTAGTSGAQ